ncbi:MAG: hypothetical protein ACJ748_14380 [Flavisolibacter sp.]
MQHYILYQAYGTTDYVNECRYSLLKFLSVYNLNPPSDIGVVIYTDQPAYFEAFAPFFHEFRLKEISQVQVKEWRGEQDFVHRAKIEMIKDFIGSIEGSLIYFDTDTYIVKPLYELFDKLDNGSFIMHEYEGVLDKSINPDFYKWERFLESASITYNEKPMTFSKELGMWNAGVVGMKGGNYELLNDVLALTDAVFKQFPKHIAEQFAFSYCFQKKAKVVDSKEYIIHYWNLKEFRRLLNLFFTKYEEESIPNLVKLVNHLDARTIQNEKTEFEKLPLVVKLVHSLTGKKWNIRQYEKKL